MWRYTSIFDMIRIVKSNLVASFYFLVVYFIYSFDGYSRAIFVLDLFFALLSLEAQESVLGYFSNIIFSDNKVQIEKMLLLLVLVLQVKVY